MVVVHEHVRGEVEAGKGNILAPVGGHALVFAGVVGVENAAKCGRRNEPKARPDHESRLFAQKLTRVDAVDDGDCRYKGGDAHQFGVRDGALEHVDDEGQCKADDGEEEGALRDAQKGVDAECEEADRQAAKRVHGQRLRYGGDAIALLVEYVGHADQRTKSKKESKPKHARRLHRFVVGMYTPTYIVLR